MLAELRIRDFAIIEDVLLPLTAGFNVLTGETGAGKSLVVGALGFILGERGDTALIRAGSERATVEGVFNGPFGAAVRDAVDSLGAEWDADQLILRRELQQSGRGRAWVNGSAVTIGTLSEIGRLLICIHGQHESQDLLSSASQRELLDAFAELEQKVDELGGVHARLGTLRVEVDQLQAEHDRATARGDELRSTANEIASARLSVEEELALDSEAHRLENAAELSQLASQAAQLLEDDDAGLQRQLALLRRVLESMQRHDGTAAGMGEMVEQAAAVLQELSTAVDRYASALDADPGRLHALNERRDAIFRVARKYGGTVESAIEEGSAALAELERIELDAESLNARRAELEATEREFGARCAVISDARRKAAVKLGKGVSRLLPELGLVAGTLECSLLPLSQSGAYGAESVEFLVALNDGHPHRPLAKVASGGELSRIMLALRTILARRDDIPTLIFDEVDAGIGGSVALNVGDLLRKVAGERQVLVITHLPQIAARAHAQLCVHKARHVGVTTADLEVVEGEARVHELARMLAGDAESAAARAHARELLKLGAGARASSEVA